MRRMNYSKINWNAKTNSVDLSRCPLKKAGVCMEAGQ